MGDFFKKAKAGLQDLKEVRTNLGKLSFSTLGSSDSRTSENADRPAKSPAASLEKATVDADTEARSGPRTSAASSPHVMTPTTTTSLSSIAAMSIDPSPPVTLSGLPGAPTRLSLAARKSIRDDWESKREEAETKISEALGTPWRFVYDQVGVLSYSVGKDFPTQNPGIMFHEYSSGIVQAIEGFVAQFGADGAEQLNAVAPSHAITLEPTSDKNLSYGGCDILHDALVILFKIECLGTNAHNVVNVQCLSKAVNRAAVELSAATVGNNHSLNLVARNSIAQDWDPVVDEILSKARGVLDMPELVFVPNFDKNYAKLRVWESVKKNKPSDPQWDSKIGAATLEYFVGFQGQLTSPEGNFEDDELLREGFKEAVSSNQVVLRVVDELNDEARKSYHQRYHDCTIENGVLYLETLSGSWWSNASNVAGNLVKRL